MTQYSNQMKVCAVCSNWSGIRRPLGRYIAEVDDRAPGKCYATIPGIGVDRTAASSCPRFELWPAIR